MKNTNNFSYKVSFVTRFHIDIYILMLIVSLSLYSIMIVWSASGQNIYIMQRKLIQILIGFIIMFLMAQISPRFYEKWSFCCYNISILLLIYVNIFGEIINGAQRWLNFGIINFQPSEIIKITLPLIVGRIVNRSIYPPNIKVSFMILFFILIPTVLIGIQPDLGTAILIVISGISMLFLTGANWKLFIIIFIILFCFLPILWFFCMNSYQQNRINVLIFPKTDPFGTGYHIIQSKIAIGSGGVFGKGWLHGTQSQLEFLPERHTDFIFAVIAEELGLVGVCVLLILYILLILRCILIAINITSIFSKFIVSSFTLIFFIYIFVNIAMVSGILPVVGIPLPLISYGGSCYVILMATFGIIMSIKTNNYFISKKL